MHHLILNAFPRHFKFNSVYAMQPFYTPATNKAIFEKFKKSHLYSFDPPTLEPPVIPIVSHAALRTVLADKKNFRVPWGARMASLESYMLASDTDENAKQRELVKECIYGPEGSLAHFAEYTADITAKLLKEKAYPLGKNGMHQVDIVADIGNMVALHFAAALCYLPLDNTKYTPQSLYKVLANLTMYVFSDVDPTKSWARRRVSQAGTAKLCSDVEEIVKRLPAGAGACPAPAARRGLLGGALKLASDRVALRTEQVKSLVGGATSSLVAAAASAPARPSGTGPLDDYGVKMAQKLLTAGRGHREVAEILVGTAAAFVANTATAVGILTLP